VDLAHVAPHHHVRHPGRRRELTHVVVRRLLDAAERIERQRVVDEELGRALRHRDQLRERHARERRMMRRLLHQIAADEPEVRLTHLGDRLARLVVHRTRHVEALVGTTETEDWKMDHGSSDYRLPAADYRPAV
jgi:hypothetical protein